MKIIYDMSTGNILEPCLQLKQKTQSHAPEMHLLSDVQLRPINTTHQPDQQIPPDLIMMDLDIFLNSYSD